MWDLWWTKWHWDRFFPEYFGFPCQFHSTGAPLYAKTKKLIILIIFITGLHNKPQGCGVSAASAAGPVTTQKKEKQIIKRERERINMKEGLKAGRKSVTLQKICLLVAKSISDINDRNRMNVRINKHESNNNGRTKD
jgi:hypothetical protein